MSNWVGLLWGVIGLVGCSGTISKGGLSGSAGTPANGGQSASGAGGGDSSSEAGSSEAGSSEAGSSEAGSSEAGSSEAGEAGASGIRGPGLTPGFYLIPMLLAEGPDTAGLYGALIERTNRIFYVADDASWVMGSSAVRTEYSETDEVYGWTETDQVGLGAGTRMVAINSDASELVIRQTDVSNPTGVLEHWNVSTGFSHYDDVKLFAGYTATAFSSDTLVSCGSVAHDLGGNEYTYQPAVQSPKQGIQLIDNLSGYSSCSLYSISGDGKHAFGDCYNGDVSPMTVRFGVHWSEATGLEPLSQLLGQDGCGGKAATRANQDGTVVVGQCDHDPGSFRWTLHDGLSFIAVPGGDGYIDDFTEDGHVVLGENGQTVLRWTPEGGTEVFTPFAGADATHLAGRSADGSILAGTSYLSTSYAIETQRAFRWTPGTGMQPLPALAGDTWSLVNGVSRDGAVIVGASGHDTSSNAVFWDAQGAVHSVAEVLTNAGIDFAGSQLLSTDGARNARVLWGSVQGSNRPQVWVVRLPP